MRDSPHRCELILRFRRTKASNRSHPPAGHFSHPRINRVERITGGAKIIGIKVGVLDAHQFDHHISRVRLIRNAFVLRTSGVNWVINGKIKPR